MSIIGADASFFFFFFFLFAPVSRLRAGQLPAGEWPLVPSRGVSLDGLANADRSQQRNGGQKSLLAGDGDALWFRVP